MLLLRLFKDHRIAGHALVVAGSLAFFLPSILQQAPPEPQTGMPLYNLIFGWLCTHPVLNPVLALLHYWIIAYLLDRIAYRYLLLEHRSLMPALFFLLLAFALPSARQLTPGLSAFLFFLWTYMILLRLHEAEKDDLMVFRATLVLALGSLFYLHLIWFIPLIWISSATLHKTSWREWTFPLIAFLICGIFLITWYWGIKDSIDTLTTLLGENFKKSGSAVELTNRTMPYFGLILLLILLASLYIINRFQTRKTMVQNIYQVFFFVFLAGAAFFIFAAGFSPHGILYMAFPACYLLAYYFHRQKSHWSHELVLWILVGLSVFLQLPFR